MAFRRDYSYPTGFGTRGILLVLLLFLEMAADTARPSSGEGFSAPLDLDSGN